MRSSATIVARETSPKKRKVYPAAAGISTPEAFLRKPANLFQPLFSPSQLQLDAPRDDFIRKWLRLNIRGVYFLSSDMSASSARDRKNRNY